jgi:hypothetical protein
MSSHKDPHQNSSSDKAAVASGSYHSLRKRHSPNNPASTGIYHNLNTYPSYRICMIPAGGSQDTTNVNLDSTASSSKLRKIAAPSSSKVHN